ncbi:MAG: hypothetical protein AAB974_02665 [Patescibacteria group bacterium]
MRISHSLAVSSLAVLLLGAGCTQAAEPAANAPVVNRPTTNAPAANTPANANVNAPAPAAGVRDLPAATGVDGTWKTYSNAVLGFSFQTPTKGKYAPEWEVKFIAATDTHLQDGCYSDIYETTTGREGTPERVSVGAREFCHASMGDGFAGGFGYVDTYTTQIDGRSVAVIFRKIAHSPAACMDSDPVCADAFAKKAMVLSFASGRSLFILDEYQAQLDTIIATFLVTE